MSWEGGSTRTWRRMRAAVLERDRLLFMKREHPTWCRVNVDGVCVGASVPMHVHHVHGKSSGCPGCAADRSDHLVAACKPCNLAVGDPARQPDPPVQQITRW